MPFIRAFMVVVVIFAGTAVSEGYWPQWRGPLFRGVSPEKGLPTQWSETENIVWKTPLPSWSGATPIVWGDRVFVMSPSRGGEDGHGAEATRPAVGREILLLCLDRHSGEILWERELGAGNERITKQNDSSPSPVTDGQHVWALTGTGVLTGLTMDGEQRWQRRLQEEYGDFGLLFGYGSSPLLHEGKIIVQVLHGYHTDDPSWLAAFDGATGETIWRVERPTDARHESPDAYTTPLPVESGDGTVIGVSGGDYVTGHHPDTGAELWRAAGLNPRDSERNRMIASSVAADGVVYAMSTRQPLFALRTDGEGDITETHTLWTWSGRHGPDVPTPALDGGRLYLVGDNGTVTCLAPSTGTVVWGPERAASGTISASPLVADGKVYITNEDAVTTVIAAGDTYETLATNTLDAAYTLSSIAVAEGRLFLRTATHLYCIGNPGK